jgi:hypothetical protein
MAKKGIIIVGEIFLNYNNQHIKNKMLFVCKGRDAIVKQLVKGHKAKKKGGGMKCTIHYTLIIVAIGAPNGRFLKLQTSVPISKIKN